MWYAGARLSPDGVYRTWLERTQLGAGTMAFIMLNPSTADDQVDDPTIRRCLGFTEREGLSRMVVVNLFTARTPHPRVLLSIADPVGPDADAALSEAMAKASGPRDRILCAWGACPWARGPLFEAHARQRARVGEIAMRHDRTLWCLGLTKQGYPRHPLYVRADTPLQVYEPLLPPPTAGTGS